MHISAGDTAWMLMATALVLFHDAGPGALLRRARRREERHCHHGSVAGGDRNRLNPVDCDRILAGFRPGPLGDRGGLQNFMLRGIGSKPTSFAPHIPPLLFMVFQMMFAVITPALIAGAFVNRMHFRDISCSSACGRCLSTARSPTGCGEEDSWGPVVSMQSTLPAVRWSMSWPGLPLWLRSSTSGAATSLTGPTICPWSCSCGHLVVRLVRLQRRQRRKRWLSGRVGAREYADRSLCRHGGLDGRRVGLVGASLPGSASPRARWPVWPPSPRRRAMFPPGPRSSSVAQQDCSATGRSSSRLACAMTTPSTLSVSIWWADSSAWF